MQGVLSGFFVIGVVVGVGYLLAALRVFGEQTQLVFSKVSFYVAMPVLFVTMLAEDDIASVLSVDLVASLVSIGVVSLLWLGSVRLVWKLPVAETVVGTFACAYVNAGNLGLPIATYVLDSPTRVVPVMLTQLLVLQPIGLAMLDLATGARHRFTLRAFLGRFVRNPLTIATFLGAALSVAEIAIPPLLRDPLDMIGATAVPMMLMAFGISLRLGRRPDRSAGRILAWQSLLKLLVMPAVAWAFGRFVMHLGSADLLAVTVMAALPTAQNVVVISTTYGRGQQMARDTTFVTTLGSIATILAIGTLLS